MFVFPPPLVVLLSWMDGGAVGAVRRFISCVSRHRPAVSEHSYNNSHNSTSAHHKINTLTQADPRVTGELYAPSHRGTNAHEFQNLYFVMHSLQSLCCLLESHCSSSQQQKTAGWTVVSLRVMLFSLRQGSICYIMSLLHNTDSMWLL